MSGNPADIIQRLQTDRGEQFEGAVIDAFNYLGFDASLTRTQEAESDGTAEALLAESPYFVVIECCAVDQGNEVGYEKIGQIRGNFPAYLDERRQRIFKTGYKLLVGKPAFSSNARARADPDVCLIQATSLIKMIDFHSKYHFSQDELELVMSVAGELTEEHLRNIVNIYQRRISIYALVCLSLIMGHAIESENRRRPFIPAEQVVGQVLGYSEMLQIDNVQDYEIRECIRDMSSPILKIIDSRDDSVRLTSVSLKTITANLGEMGKEFFSKLEDYSNRLRARL